MTLREALIAKLRPYTLEDDTIEVLFAERGFDDASEDYEPATQRMDMKRVERDALWQLISLAKEQDNGSTQQYDVDALMERLRRLDDELGDDELKPKNIDISDWW